ncbi:MAG: hypothetical protein J6J52_07150 [Oscillospiraceae bacterium]|nr:hypothetical protein [Oscillospiraceae bacterium]
MKNGILALLCAVGGLALGVLIGSLIFGSKKKCDCICDETDDSLGFDDDFFTDDIIEDVE